MAEGVDVEALARACAPIADGRVEHLRRLSGGASRETWTFELVDAGGRSQALVLRRDPGANTGHSERATEYAVLQAAAAGRVPVPRVRVLLVPDHGLGTGFVMDRVEGETIARKILRDGEYANARPRLAAQLGDAAARIHTIGPTTLPALPEHDGAAQIAQYRQTLDAFDEPHPAFELGLRWLDAHVPPGPGRRALVHGDYRNGNIIVGADGLRAVLDWELAHLGDPIEDLGWLCVKSWRFGVVDKIVGGFGDIPDMLDAYADAGGGDVHEDTLRFWVVFGTLKWGVICISQAFTHLTRAYRSVELATLGRRVAEMEWDLLNLLDGGW